MVEWLDEAEKPPQPPQEINSLIGQDGNRSARVRQEPNRHKTDLSRPLAGANRSRQEDMMTTQKKRPAPTSERQDLSDLDLNSIKGVVENADGR